MSESAALALREVPLPSRVERLEPLTAVLNALSSTDRVAWIRTLGWSQMGHLWRLAADTELRASDFVGADGSVWVHPGQNALPLFNRFEKRFARVGDEIVGYNHTSSFVTFWTGPGHFRVVDSPDKPGEVWIDYRTLPKARHAEFPDLAPNDRGLFPRLTYGGMVDKVRRVSAHVYIGDSFTGERQETPKYVKFVLVSPGGAATR